MLEDRAQQFGHVITSIVLDKSQNKL